MTKPTCSRADTLVDYLRGTCHSLEEGCRVCADCGEDALTDGERAYIDEHIMRCEQCSWWDDSGEFSDDQICNDCARDA